MVDAAINAAEHLQATKDPQWHRVFTETLQRLHLTKPQRPTQHVATEDDPWLAELDRAFGDLEGRIATADVWMIPVSILQQKRLDLKPFGAAEQSARPRAARKLSIAKVRSSFQWRKYGRKRRELALPFVAIYPPRNLRKPRGLEST